MISVLVLFGSIVSGLKWDRTPWCNKAAHPMVARKQKERKDLGSQYILRGHTPSGLCPLSRPHFLSPPPQQHHMLQTKTSSTSPPQNLRQPHLGKEPVPQQLQRLTPADDSHGFLSAIAAHSCLVLCGSAQLLGCTLGLTVCPLPSF